MCGREMTAGAQVDQRAGRTRVGGRDSRQQPLAIGAPQGIRTYRPSLASAQRSAPSVRLDIHRPALAEGKIGDGHILAIRRGLMFSFENT